MPQPDSHNTYLSGYKPQATLHHEWRTAENSAAHLLPILIEKAAKNPTLSLLDVGAGSGTITASLAKYIPHGTLTAFDLSPEILSKAVAHAKSTGVPNISTEQGSVYALPFPDDTFDIVHASQLLAHLDDPQKAISEMVRVTKPHSGIVALRESDLRAWSFYPELKGMREMSDMLCAVHEANNGHVRAGTQLVSWCLENGVPREQIKASAGTWCYSTAEEREMWGSMLADRCINGEARKKALELGIANETQLQEMVEGWQKWAKAEEGWFGCLHGEVLLFL